MARKGRLATLFEDFLEDHEIMHSSRDNGRIYKIGIHYDGKLIQARYEFFDDTTYEYGAILGKVDPTKAPQTANDVLNSKPFPGLVERFINEKFSVLGTRENMQYLEPEAVNDCFLMDIARIREYFRTRRRFWEP